MDNLVWLVLVLDKLNMLLGFIFITGMASFAFLFIKSIAEWEGYGFKRYVFTIALCVILLITIPSKSTAHKMVVVYGGVEVLQTDEAKKLGEKGLKAFNKVLDEYLEEKE